MATSYLDKDGLLYFLQQIRPNATPQMDGTASTGTAKRFANQDHVHPSDTSKADKSSTVTNVSYNSTSKKIQKTINGTTSDVVTLASVATSGSYNDLTNTPTIPAGVEPSTTTPKMDGTAAVGTETKFARGDHIHPSDTTRVPTSRTVNGKALSANITLYGDEIDTSLEYSSTALASASEGPIDGVLGALDDWLDGAEDKLAGIAAGAEVNQNAFSTVEIMKRNGTSVTSLAADSKTDTVRFTEGTNITLAASAASDNVTISTSAEVNQNAFSNVKVGSTTIVADDKTDTLELVAGSNVTLTPDATNDKVTIAATDTTYSDANASTHGLMTAAHYTKLEGIETGAEVNVNADWNAASGDAQILNKPTLGAAAAKGVTTTVNSSSSTDLPTAGAVYSAIQTAVTGAASFQGTAPTTFAPTNYKAGYYWVVGTAGTYVGQECEPGDMIFAVTGTSTTRGYVADDFTVVQTNLSITSITNAEIDTIVAA